LSGQFGSDDVWQGVPPDRLWAEYTYIDNRPTIEANFGALAGVSVAQIEELPGNVDYLSAVRGLWHAYLNGPTMFNLRAGAQILLGLPFAEEAGTIIEVRTDFSHSQGRILIRDAAQTEIVRSYSFPKSLALEVNPATGERYAVGDTVAQFAPLVEGVEIVDYVKDPKWYEGLLHQGIFNEVQKFFTFLVRVDSAAFGVDPLLFTQNFMLTIKPRTSYPYFLVVKTIGDTEFSITDEVDFTVTLNFYDNLCSLWPSSTLIDDPRAKGGGLWNHVDDTAGNPWGVDTKELCPSDTVSVHLCQVFSAPAVIPVDSIFVVDQNLMDDARFHSAASPFTVPTGTTGLSIPAAAGATVPLNGTITSVRVILTGGPGSDPANYELVIAINAVDTLIEAFTSNAGYTIFTATVSQAVSASDVLTARIRHSGGSPRSPAWTDIRVDASMDLGPWTVDMTLPAGNYCSTRSLFP
jgi:hypothetical protein